MFGVKSGMFRDCTLYSYKDGFFYAPSDTYGIECIQQITEVKTAKGTSLSAAYITGHLANLLKNKKNLSYKEAKEFLIQGSEKEG